MTTASAATLSRRRSSSPDRKAGVILPRVPRLACQAVPHFAQHGLASNPWHPAGATQNTYYARGSKSAVLAALVLLAALAAGCNQVNYTAPERYDRGLVVCLSGAGGMMGECDRIRDGLASGGVDRAIEVFDWSRGDVLSDQVSAESNRRLAGTLARRLESYMLEHPGRPVHLMGISAGTGLVVWALENLQQGFQVDGAVLMASSLDTKYNLGPALAKVRDHIYSFGSPIDPVLSMAVTVAGTVDRGGGLAGGLVGFSPPANATDADKDAYKQKLSLVTWWPLDWALGNTGTHLGSTSPTFVRVRIAPLIMGKEPPKTEAEGAPKAAQSSRTEKPRFYGWRVRPSAAQSASARPAASGQQAAARQPQAGPPAPEKIDESAFFAETGRLP